MSDKAAKVRTALNKLAALMLVSGASLIVGAVYLLLGTGAALLVGGVAVFALGLIAGSAAKNAS